jgi:hypothetical protein
VANKWRARRIIKASYRVMLRLCGGGREVPPQGGEVRRAAERAQLTRAVALLNILRQEQERHIGKSQCKRPSKRMQRTPHQLETGARRLRAGIKAPRGPRGVFARDRQQ